MIQRLKAQGFGILVALLSREALDRLSRALGKGSRLGEIDLVFEVAEAEIERGTMVDVGARFGTSLQAFARAGWDVLAVEPDPRNQIALNVVCNLRPNVRLDTRACWDERGTLTLWEDPVRTSITTLIPFDSQHRGSGSVEVLPLRELLVEREVERLSVLKVDTEGADLRVLVGAGWDGAHRPAIVMCEFDERKVDHGGHEWNLAASFLHERGYRVLVSDVVSRTALRGFTQMAPIGGLPLHTLRPFGKR
ncbi:MAG: FkbM family methyltransferase [Dehalococcoidia bacterium]